MLLLRGEILKKSNGYLKKKFLKNNVKVSNLYDGYSAINIVRR